MIIVLRPQLNQTFGRCNRGAISGRRPNLTRDGLSVEGVVQFSTIAVVDHRRSRASAA